MKLTIQAPGNKRRKDDSTSEFLIKDEFQQTWEGDGEPGIQEVYLVNSDIEGVLTDSSHIEIFNAACMRDYLELVKW